MKHGTKCNIHQLEHGKKPSPNISFFRISMQKFSDNEKKCEPRDWYPPQTNRYVCRSIDFLSQIWPTDNHTINPPHLTRYLVRMEDQGLGWTNSLSHEAIMVFHTAYEFSMVRVIQFDGLLRCTNGQHRRTEQGETKIEKSQASSEWKN